MCAYPTEHWLTADVDEMRRHDFDTVLFCVTEDMLRRRDMSVRPVVEHTKQQGLSCEADLWGFAKVLGGEPPSAFAADPSQQACLNNPDFRSLMSDAIDYVQALGFDRLFIDEPNFANVENPNPCSCCQGKERELVRLMADYAGRLSIRSTVCMISTEHGYKVLESLAAERTVHGVATDPYYSNFPSSHDSPHRYVGGWARRLKGLEARYGVKPQIAVQGFHLPMPMDDKRAWRAEADARPWHEIPLWAAEAALAEGVRRILFWAYQACSDFPELAPPYPERVWDMTRTINARVHHADPAGHAGP